MAHQDRTNEDRIDDMRKLLAKRDRDWLDDAEAVITDLLADLMHLCQNEKIDFHRQLSRAQTHFSAEVAEEVAA